MSAEEELPLTIFVENFLRDSFPLSPFTRFQEHVVPLGLDARGDVLIVGLGAATEELAIIEPDVIAGQVSSITTLGSEPVFCNLDSWETKLWPHRIKPEILPETLGDYFYQHPDKYFDTILFIGTISRNLDNKIAFLTSRLKPGGKAFLTVNYFKTPERPPITLPVVDGCRVKLISDIPPNPNYDQIPTYYGIVIEKEPEVE